ncbi:MAG: UbiA family prenyltransferase [Gammaproteobacteria bacterium]
MDHPSIRHRGGQDEPGPDVSVSGPSDAAIADLAPLVVDLDGTLTPTDTLMEAVVRTLRHHPADLLRLPFWLLKGRAAFKEILASKSRIPAEHLPYRAALLDYLRGEREKGRRIVLATAAHWRIADAVAAQLRLFDMVLASDASRNLKGTVKLEAIRERVGERFVYAGDSAADLPIWRAASAAVLVGVPSGVAKAIRSAVPIEREFPREKAGITTWLRALRVHQWLKNLLLFVPLLTAFSFLEADKLATMLVAFFSFCCAASATYLVNDLWDLDSDRVHPSKYQRPFASAQIPIVNGVAMAAGAVALALALALAVSLGFSLMLVLYLAMTSLYSGLLKTYVLIDVLTLALLYTLRILAGSVALGIVPSSWLLAFSVFIFLSLALVKRCSELVALQHLGVDTTSGRDYRVSDLVVLWPLGIGSALCAVVVFGLFISAAETQARYASPRLLWLVAVGFIYWLSRLWIKTVRGEMHDDPVVFAMRDRGSRITIWAMLATTLAAHFIPLAGP